MSGTTTLRSVVRRLRRQQTDAEKRPWHYLRDRQCGGYKFRRQVQIGRFIVDFVCLDSKLIVEVDGGQHLEQRQQDDSRSRDLKSRGFRVLRFWNHDVLNDTAAVLEAIHQALMTPSSPALLPEGEGRGEPPRIVCILCASAVRFFISGMFATVILPGPECYAPVARMERSGIRGLSRTPGFRPCGPSSRLRRKGVEYYFSPQRRGGAGNTFKPPFLPSSASLRLCGEILSSPVHLPPSSRPARVALRAHPTAAGLRCWALQAAVEVTQRTQRRRERRERRN
ncbi:MAG: endonuclease domain-containing protein [Chromatiales bacterium]|nr:endonuclease domain-containing protein [Chromatiales bacterium]